MGEDALDMMVTITIESVKQPVVSQFPGMLLMRRF